MIRYSKNYRLIYDGAQNSKKYTYLLIKTKKITSKILKRVEAHGKI
jgi:hypothetical protein